MIRIGSIVWGVVDIGRAVAFWSEALHYELKYPASDDWAILVPKNGDGLQLSLSKVSSSHARRHHIDIFTDEPEAEVNRLLALGAVKKPWDYPPDADYVVLQDPEGNPFCVVDINH
ncbi:MAG: VOC family protein [Clostridia bacterium]|nr:VOC family protein [Clostridia bacterium]